MRKSIPRKNEFFLEDIPENSVLNQKRRMRVIVEFKIQLRWFGALASKLQQVLKIIPKFSFSLS